MWEMREASFIRGCESRFMIYCAKSPNPTNAVGGSFILNLQRDVDGSTAFPNPTNAVGGLFILNLQRVARRESCEARPTNAVGEIRKPGRLRP